MRGEGGLYSRLPSAAYTDGDFLALEYRRWLARTWLYVGRGHEIPNPGDVMPVPGHPFILVRNKKGEVRAFQNACRHRGHALVNGPCQGLRLFTCPYHAWSYDLDGKLIGTPHFGGDKVHEVAGFDPADYGLVPLRCETWHDWIFLNIDGEAEPLADFVAPMARQMPDVDFGKLTHYLTIDAGALGLNWKLAMENNMEPYHVPVVHRSTAAGQPLSAHRAFVERHDPVLTQVDPHAPLMLGNGDLGFTADITGLQTFPEQYSRHAPLLTMAQWAWHSFPNPQGYAEADGLVNVEVPGRGAQPYPWMRSWDELKTRPALVWLRAFSSNT